MKKNNSLDKILVKVIIGTACGLMPVAALIIFLLRQQLPPKFTQGFLAGAVLGLANLFFLIQIIVSTIKPDGVKKGKALLGILGINVTVFGMFFLIWKKLVEAIGLAAGFTLSLAIMLISSLILIKTYNDSGKEE